ncbi:MAG: MarR family transcriptional regulator [Clostridia bacterium]|nr:MarR family transcriptional regulator [Clostridia bacterium]
MAKTKEQIIIEKLRKTGHKARMGILAGYDAPMDKMPPHGMHKMPPHIAQRLGHKMPPPGFHPPFGHRPSAPFFHRELILMILLDAGEGGMRQKDIAKELGINPSSLSEQIDRLESDRYIERRANPEDKRSTLIVLTEKGRARAYEVADERQKAAAQFCKSLTEDEKDTLIALLEKLIAD